MTITSQPRWIIAIAIVGIALLLFFFRGCNCGGGRPTKSDTISVIIDTVYAVAKKDTHYVPMPYEVVYRKNIPVPVHDTLEIFDYHDVDTMRILAQYHAQRIYSDTQQIKFGTAVINDTVTQNRITGRSISVSQSIPEVTRTVTLTQPKRTIAYLGFIVAGNERTPVYGVGASFGLKFKNDKYLGASYILTREGDPLYALDFKFPIKLKK